MARTKEERVQNLTEAFYETYKVLITENPSSGSAAYSIGEAIRLVITRNNFDGFTKTKGAREFRYSMGRDEFIDEMCYRYLNSFSSIDEIPIEGVREAYYRSNHANKGHRDTMQILRQELANDNGKMLFVIIKNIFQEVLFSKKFVPEGMKNVVPNLPNMVKYTGAEKRYQRKELELGSMAFVSDIGKRSKTQENAVLLIHHPENPDFKMMVLADGEGPGVSGERASELAVALSRHWFNELNSRHFKRSDDLKKELNGLIEKIQIGLENLNSKNFKKAGTTFTCVIRGEHDTIIVNIGDNRVYAVGSTGIEQLTDDDTKAYAYYEAGNYSKDVIGHLEEEYRIPERLGLSSLKCGIKLIPNSDFETFIMTTSGVTDLVDLENDPDLIAVCRETPRAELSMRIARYIADRAYSTAKMPGPELINGTGFRREAISGGQRNATVVVDAGYEREVGIGEKIAGTINGYVDIEGVAPEKIDKLGKKADRIGRKLKKGVEDFMDRF